MAQRAALSGRDFQRDLYLEAFARRMCLVDRFRNRLDPVLDSRSHMSARMGDENRHAQRLASMDLVDQSLDRLEPQRVIRRAEIHQVGIMRDHGADAGLGLKPFEVLDFFLAVGLRRPLPRRLGENLDTFAADLLAAVERLANFSGDRHMRPEKWTTR